MTYALNGIKVLELSTHISGPYCAKLLGAFGAEVIKIEKPGQGDGARWQCSFMDDVPHPEKSALFLYLNTNKKSITLDIESREGEKIIKGLVKETDVLIENFMPGVMAELSLGYETLKEVNPGLIMASITDFGQTGVYRDFTGGRLVDYAMGGYMYVNGDPDREPLAGSGEQPAYQGGLNAYIGILSALMAREATNKGDHIDISIMECMASIHQYNINRCAYSGKIQTRTGNRHMWTHPVTIYPCKDGYVSISAVTDDQLERMLMMMGMPDVLENPTFKTGRNRLIHADEFDGQVAPWFRERTSRMIVGSCQEWRVPAARVNTVDDLLKDPHYRFRNFWVDVAHPVAGRLPYPTAPFKMSRTPACVARAPLLGEHNQEIYIQRLRIHREVFVRLKKEGVI